jgi:hypothetical protein
MKLFRALPLLAAVAAAQGLAVTVTGTVGGAGPEMRIAGFVVSPYGQPLQEFVGVSVEDGRFRLEVPTTVPGARAQSSLTPQTVSWPGVIDPVAVSAPVQSAELRFFVYRDQNGNGRYDDAETLREVTPMVGAAALFITWVSGDVTVAASKGYQAVLKRGWNAFLVEVGRTVSVRPYSENQTTTVRMRR